MTRPGPSRVVLSLVVSLIAAATLCPAAMWAYAPLGSAYGVIVDDPTTVIDALPILAEARFGWARFFAYWQIMEPSQGTRVFTYLDAQVNAALANGLQVEIVFATIPGWANGTAPNCGLFTPACAVPPTDPAFFRSFVTAVVQHYGTEVTYYELWNEPNYNNFWNGTNTQYINDILINGAAAVHAASTTAKTVGPATAGSLSFFEGTLSSACNSLDILSSHFFGSPGGTESPTTMFQDLDTNYKPWIQAHCNKPLWITAWSDDSTQTSETIQAQYFTSAIQGLPSRSYLGKLFIYRWVDGSTVPLSTPGLVGLPASGYRRKPSFVAAQAAILGILGEPGVATQPSPADKAATAAIGTTLNWVAGANAALHDVYFGAGSPSYRGRQSTTAFTPPSAEMRYEQVYSWRIDEVDSTGQVTTGTMWTFTIQQNPELSQEDIVVQADPNAVFPTGAYFLTVVQAAATPTYAPFPAMIANGTNTDNLWSATANFHQKTGFNVFTAAATESLANVTVSIGGLTNGVLYDVYGRYATAPASSGNGITMGLNPAALTTYDQSSPGAVVTRSFANWQEDEVYLGQSSVSNNAVNLTISNANLSASANWSGVRLSVPTTVEPGQTFYTVAPCRVLDTRPSGPHLTESAPSLTVQVTGVCGIPTSASSVSVNVTVVNASIDLWLQGYPGDISPPGTNAASSSSPSNLTIAAFSLLPLAYSGAGTLGFTMTLTPPATSGSMDLVLDVNGYFAP